MLEREMGLRASAEAAFSWAKSLLRKGDRYDLGELRRVHEDISWRPGDPVDLRGAPALVVCARCRNEYDSRAHACPRCGAGG